MTKDYTEEVKKLVKKYNKEDIEYHKPLKYLCQRNSLTQEEIEEAIMSCKGISLTELQEKPYETRYALFFVYNKRKGKCFVLTFDDKITVVTIYPMGRKTILRYKKKRFKKS
jgi:hypothetical protein